MRRIVAVLCICFPALSSAQDEDRALRPIVEVRLPIASTLRTIDVPVDASITSLMVSIESPRDAEPALARPGGTPVTDADPDVEVARLTTMDLDRGVPVALRMYTVARPQPGIWQVAIGESGRAAGSMVTVKAMGDTPIAFGSFEFVQKQEGVHGGYFRIDGMPLSGVPATARACLWNGPGRATFRMIDPAGTPLGDMLLTTGKPDTGDDEFLGTLDLPRGPFRVVMNAVDAAGAPIQRQYPVSFRAQPIALSFDYGGSPVVGPGRSRRFRFAVTNVGASAATYGVSVETSMGQVLELAPVTVTIEPGTSATPSFVLRIPASVNPLDSIHLRITATDTADPATTNSAFADLELERAGDRDNDYVEDRADNCPDVPNADQIDANRNGVGDACDAVYGGALTVAGLSPQSGPPGTSVTITGSGFSTAGPSGVLLNGLPVEATAVGATELVFSIPPDAPVGPVSVVVGTGRGMAMCPIPFVVRR